MTTSTATFSAPSATSVSPSSSRAPGTESSVPPSPDGSATYFTPTDPTSYALSGPVVVEQARQDPFSNLLQRGALHEHPVVLDVTGSPDEPWVPGSTTLLFGTCRCPDRGQGLRLTLDDASAVRALGDGVVGIRGTFTVAVTARDAMSLRRVG